MKQPKGRDLVITHLSWLTNRVFECVLSPHNFPGLRLVFPRSGIVPIQDVKDALKHIHDNVNAAFQLLVTYRICLPCGIDHSLALFPSKAPDSMLTEFLQQIADLIALLGRVLTATVKRVPLSPVLLHTIALDVLEYYDIPITNTNTSAYLWQDGLIFWLDEVLVRLQREYPDGAIALTVGGEENSEDQCLKIADKIQEIGSTAWRKVSAGSQAVWKILSCTELAAHAQVEAKTCEHQRLTVQYSEKEVKTCD